MSDTSDELMLDMETLYVHLQQFFDEWHFRCLHAGLAEDWDRTCCVTKAIELFEAAGLDLSFTEKDELIECESDEELLHKLMQKMPQTMKETAEHFMLQMQLVLSTATRVRNILEEGTPEEVARIMEEGDTGISQQILKEVVIEAAREVREYRDVHNSWEHSMQVRILRLSHCSDLAETSTAELEKVTGELLAFSKQHNDNARKVLTAFGSNTEKLLLGCSFSAWVAFRAKYKADEEIHAQCKREMDDLEVKLFQFKSSLCVNFTAVINRESMMTETQRLVEILAAWMRFTTDERTERECYEKVKVDHDKLKAIKDTQKQIASHALLGLAGREDGMLTNIVFQAWTSSVHEAKKSLIVEKIIKDNEDKMEACIAKAAAGLKNVFSKMLGSTDTGLKGLGMKAWMEFVSEVRKAREQEKDLARQKEEFQQLRVRQKDAASGAGERSAVANELVTMMQVFMTWSTEAKLERVRKYYTSKMDTKQHQLEAVQTMFKSFATQLEQGMGSSPRTTTKPPAGGRSSTRPV